MKGRPNVCIVVLDAVQARFLSAYGNERNTSPNIERLINEDDAIRFEKAVSPSGVTVDSVSSLLSGLYPIEHRAGNRGTFDIEQPTLPEFLSDRGYRTGMGTCNPFLTPWFGFDRGVDNFEAMTHRFDRGMNVRQFFSDNKHLSKPRRYLRFFRESLNRDFFHHLGNGLQFRFGLFEGEDDGATKATDWAKDFTSGDTPWFCYLHFTETHMTKRGSLPYTLPDRFSRKFLPNTAPEDYDLADTGPSVEYSDEELDVHRRLYQGAIYYLDKKIGELRTHLKSIGEWDETLFIVTADHGECIGEQNRLGHGILYEPGVHVPLVIKPSSTGPDPSEEHQKSRTNLLGVYRTIANRIDSPPEHVRGPDLFGPPPSSVMVQNFSSTWKWSRYAGENDPWFAYYRERMKILQQGDHVELFDMESDPMEYQNLAEENSDCASKMSDLVASELADLETADVEESSINIDQSIENRLRELGYID
ncbi:sulfatase [Haloterrigena salifodinae]|uniref:Sulfatase n=1 Tax=Haloterrigena salifodinae TaxID=2675099 RepID=A0A8T8DX00_9EURY|nr:sulfatase [Haloterrigena salifodinae]QRV13995.1 sulfatase [Haloterrigena salifodinae]